MNKKRGKHTGIIPNEKKKNKQNKWENGIPKMLGASKIEKAI